MKLCGHGQPAFDSGANLWKIGQALLQNAVDREFSVQHFLVNHGCKTHR